MTMRRRPLLAFSVLSAVLPARLVRAADQAQFSEAEQLLFTVDHLKNLKSAARLDYEYRKRGSLEEEFTDPVQVSVSPMKSSGGRDVKVAFLSGPRHMDLPPVEDARGNPLILYFLEREVREMNRLTGGSMNYYRKRIRITLAEAAEVKPVTPMVNGKPVAAREIFIAPYREDPARSRYERFAEKVFFFTLSDQVPGGIVEMRSELKEPVAGAEPALLLAEAVTFVARH